MITQGIIYLLLILLTPIVSLLPYIDSNSLARIVANDRSVFVVAGQFIRDVLYFIPSTVINLALTYLITLTIFKIVIAFLKLLKSIIPIV